MEFSRFTELSNRVRVQLAADLIRAQALLHQGGWFIDLDAVWMHSVPSLSVLVPPQCGHFFGSLPANPALQGHTVAQYRVHWMMNYLKSPGDGLHLASPFAFPKGSPVLKLWIEDMQQEFSGSRKVHYNTPFRMLQNGITKWGLESAVADEHVCSPMSRFHKAKCLDSAKNHLFDMDKVCNAMCVNNFWQTSKGLVGMTAHEKGSLANLDPDSCWAQLLKQALPNRRKRKKLLLVVKWHVPWVMRWPRCVAVPRINNKAMCRHCRQLHGFAVWAAATMNNFKTKRRHNMVASRCDHPNCNSLVVLPICSINLVNGLWQGGMVTRM